MGSLPLIYLWFPNRQAVYCVVNVPMKGTRSRGCPAPGDEVFTGWGPPREGKGKGSVKALPIRSFAALTDEELDSAMVGYRLGPAVFSVGLWEQAFPSLGVV